MNNFWWFVIGLFSPAVLFFSICFILNLIFPDEKTEKSVEYYVCNLPDHEIYPAREVIKKIKFKKNYVLLFYNKKHFLKKKIINNNCFICFYDEKKHLFKEEI